MHTIFLFNTMCLHFPHILIPIARLFHIHYIPLIPIHTINSSNTHHIHHVHLSTSYTFHTHFPIPPLSPSLLQFHHLSHLSSSCMNSYVYISMSRSVNHSLYPFPSWSHSFRRIVVFIAEVDALFEPAPDKRSLSHGPPSNTSRATVCSPVFMVQLGMQSV